MLTAPLQQWQKQQRNNGKDASGDAASAMRVTTPAQLQQQRQRNKGNNASATTATMPAQQGQRGYHCNNDEDTPKMPS
jgi:hypothetical protein